MFIKSTLFQTFVLRLFIIVSPGLLSAKCIRDYAPENGMFTNRITSDGSINLTNIAGIELRGNNDGLANANSLEPSGTKDDLAGYGLNERFINLLDDHYNPRIDAISNQMISINNTNGIIIPLTGINIENATGVEILSVMATSSDPSIIAVSGIQVNYNSPETTGSLVLTPVADAIGETTISVTVGVDDGTGSGVVEQVTEAFVVRVAANSAPTINEIADVKLDINAEEQIIQITGITSGEIGNQDMVVTATSNNTDLIPNPEVDYGSPLSIGTLSFTPVANALGIATISVTVSDNGGTLGGGVDTTMTTFDISVTGNQPPTLDAIEDIILSGLGSFEVDLNGISDGTGNTQNVTITATSDNTAVLPDPSIGYVNGDETGLLDFSPNGYGHVIITVTVKDDGGTANGGVDTIIRTFSINIGENEPPIIREATSNLSLDGLTFYLLNGQGDQAITFDVLDSNNDQITSVTAMANNPAFSDAIGVLYTSGSTSGELIFSPEFGQVGTETLAVTVKDDGGTTNNGIDERTVTITVVMTEPATYTATIENGNYHVQPFSVDKSGLAFVRSTANSYGDDVVRFQLHETSFTSSNPAQNILASGRSIVYELEEEKQYVLVMNNEGNGPGEATNAIGMIDGNVSFGYLPYFQFIEDASMDEDGELSIPISGISDGNGGVDNLTLSLDNSNEDAFASLELVANQDGTGSFQIIPTADYNGSSELTLTVTGGGGNTYDQSFDVTILPVNDVPIFTLSQNSLSISSTEIDNEFVISSNPGTIPANELDQQVIYSIDPDTATFATLSFDAATGELRLSEFVGKPEAQQQVFTITADDQQSENNTVSQSFTLSMDIVLGLLKESITRVYPIPTSDYLNIDASEVANLELVDLNGKVILRSGLVDRRVDLSSLRPGIYLVNLTNKEGDLISVNRILKK